MAPGSLSEVLRRTIIALCEVHVTYERHLEVFGSIHVRADDGRTVSFMLEELIAKLQQDRARQAASSNQRPRTPENDSKVSEKSPEVSSADVTPGNSTMSPSSGKEEKQDQEGLSDEIALMRAQYSSNPDIRVKIEKIYQENNVYIVKDEKQDSYAQFHITKVKKVERSPESQSNAYDTITSLLENDADLDKAIGQLLQSNEKNKEEVKTERQSPPAIMEGKIKVEKSGKDSEEFQKSFPGQGQPVFPSQGDFLYNNSFQFANGAVHFDPSNSNPSGQSGSEMKLFENQPQNSISGPPQGPQPNAMPGPPPNFGPSMMGPGMSQGMGPTQFGSFQGWYTLQGVGMGPQMAPNHFECPFCGVILANKTNLKNHINSAHTRTKKFNCPTCGKVFYTSSAMNIHRRRNHLGLAKKYRCSLCSKMFKIKSDLSAHMLDVHNKPRKLSPKTLHRLSQKVAQHLEDSGNE